MNPVITDLIIKRFRSIPSAQITFDNPTFLVGRNGAGKSNLVDVFAFLAEAMASPLQAVFDTRGGIAAVRNRTSGRSYPPHLGLGVLFGALNGQSTRGRYAFEVKALPNYGFEVLREQCRVLGPDGNTNWFDRSARRFKTNVKGLEPSLDPASLGLPVVGGDARFAPILRTLAGMRVYSIEPAEVQEMQDPDSGVSLRTDGSNAASVLQEIERRSGQDMEQICEALGTIVPNTTRVHTKKHGKKISLEFVQEWGGNKRLRFEAFNMSDGTLRALGLLTAVYQHPSPSLLAIEEPEATIHPGALGAVLDLLRHASRNQQVVVTTHSPEVLDAEWLQHNHLRIVNWHEGATRITGVPEGARQAMQEHLMGAGDLFRCNALEPEPALFRAPADLDAALFEDQP